MATYHITGRMFRLGLQAMQRPVMAGTPEPESPPLVSDAAGKVALIIGGAERVMHEYHDALDLIGVPPVTFVCNDMIASFPYQVDHAVTLHPDKLRMWITERSGNGFDPVGDVWAHRSFTHVTHWTPDWQGSSGLFCAKIARELGHTHVILCGVPMDPEAGHVRRKAVWPNANGFRRGWLAHVSDLKPYLRSMSGWTADLFGKPTADWLAETIPDRHRNIIRDGVRA